MMRKSLVERFWSKTQKRDDPDGCWNWVGARTRYGHFWAGGRSRQAHHLAWELTNGQIPDGLCVLHHCDNPVCVNPAHLFLGRHADNMLDMAAKGRASHGESHWRHKLTEADVTRIRELRATGTCTNRELASQFNISPPEVSSVVCLRAWAWLGKEIIDDQREAQPK